MAHRLPKWRVKRMSGGAQAFKICQLLRIQPLRKWIGYKREIREGTSSSQKAIFMTWGVCRRQFSGENFLTGNHRRVVASEDFHVKWIQFDLRQAVCQIWCLLLKINFCLHLLL